MGFGVEVRSFLVTTPLPETTRSRKFRPEIEGLRTVAFLLVAVFHIWLNRVSGGVDVFFTVAGLLVTLSLLGHIERTGYISAATFFSRLAIRLLPTAAVVLAAVLVVAFIVGIPGDPSDFIAQVLASATYWENWWLGFNAIDYLGTDTTRSPVQHFWAMSVQGQFYILWFLLFIIIAAWVRRSGIRAERAVLVLIGPVVIVSFVWSVLQTASDQPFAYFSSATRVWEFGIGAMLALVVDRIRMNAILASIVSWLSLIAIVVTGALLPVADSFPGYIALVPVLAACGIIAAGQNELWWGAGKLLGSRPLVWLGGLGYGVYLWHWPLLIFALELQDRQRAGIKTGIAVIGLALLLAYLTRKLVELPLLKARSSSVRKHPRIATAIALFSVGVVIAVSAGGLGTIRFQAHAEAVAAAERESDPCFGAKALADQSCESTGNVIPASPGQDNAAIFEGDCRNAPSDPTVRSCSWGDPDGDVRVVLLGNSHAAVWFPAFEQLAEENGWQLDTYFLPGCAVTFASRTGGSADTREACEKWVTDVADELASVAPYDYVVVSAAARRNGFVHHDGAYEGVEAGAIGYQEFWRPLIARGATILAMHDYPQLTAEAKQCALDDPRGDCGRKQSDAVVDPEREAIAIAAQRTDGAELIDMSRWFCRDGYCPAVVGDVRVHRDPDHMSATYSRSLTDPLREELAEQAGVQATSASTE